MTSTTTADPATDDARRGPPRRLLRSLLVLGFWVAVWQVTALVVGQDLLLAFPTAVLDRLADLMVTGGFWATVAHSLVRITTGFLLAVAVGVAGAVLAARSRLVDATVTPLVTAVRSTPVVSFIILVLMWTDTGRLAVVISFVMVVPIMYTNALEGIRQRDGALLEMARVFRVPLVRRLPAVDLPAVLPFLVAGCRTGVGLAWKSGVAAEMIGLPQGSIGERLYEAKLFLSSADLFAWTVVVIVVAFTLERLVVALLGRAQRRLTPVSPR